MPLCPSRSVSQALCSEHRVRRSAGDWRRELTSPWGDDARRSKGSGPDPARGTWRTCGGTRRKVLSGHRAARGGQGCSRGRRRVLGSCRIGPCPGQLRAGKTIKFIMGDAGEFSGIYFPFRKIRDFDGFAGITSLCGLLGCVRFIIPTVF